MSNIMSKVEAALVVLVPEVEALVNPFRQRFDPSAADGMPAHITINYPFLPWRLKESFDLDGLRHLFLRHSAFRFTFFEVRNFPDVLYLAPDPDQPFRDLIQSIARHYPESPPYGGQFQEVVPHLTIADVDTPEEMKHIRGKFQQAAKGLLPIKVGVEGIWLMDTCDGRWKRREFLRLRG
jgi:2'-5' RNA ligase